MQLKVPFVSTTLVLIVTLLSSTSSWAFAPVGTNGNNNHKIVRKSFLSLAIMPPEVPTVPSNTPVVASSVKESIASTVVSSSAMKEGIHSYLTAQDDSKFLSSSTMAVSLQERKIPTAEEIAAKKRNFNLWFWGGGFVAPFLATFYYFGLKFWEK